MRIRKLCTYGLAATMALYAHSASAFRAWTTIPGCAQAITASKAGVWIVGCDQGIGNNSAVYWLNTSGHFQRVTSSTATATQVGVSYGGAVWVISQAGRVGQVVTPKASGTSDVSFLSTGLASQNGIGVGTFGTSNLIFVRSPNQDAYEWTGSAWSSLHSPLVGPVNWVSVFNNAATNGILTVTNQAANFWQDGFGWVQIAGANGTLLADHLTLAAGLIFYYNDSTNAWTQDTLAPPVSEPGVRGIANQYDPSTKISIPYLIDTNGTIYQITNVPT